MILLLLLILFCPLAHADWETYALEMPDGSVTIQSLDSTVEDINSVISKNGYSPLSISRIKQSDLPANRVDREFWKKQGNRIIVDKTP